MWLMFELFEPMMKVKNEIWDIIHQKIKIKNDIKKWNNELKFYSVSACMNGIII